MWSESQLIFTINSWYRCGVLDNMLSLPSCFVYSFAREKVAGSLCKAWFERARCPLLSLNVQAVIRTEKDVEPFSGRKILHCLPSPASSPCPINWVFVK